MIELITYNPYRVLGLYADASTKEIKSIVSKMKAYVSVDKKIGFEGEFDFLKPIERSKDLILKSESALALDKDKLLSSLFWFVESSQVEEIALDYLSDGDSEKAIQVWDKATKSGKPSKNSFGAYNNYSTYLLSLYLSKNSFDKLKVSKALQLKSSLMFSPMMTNYVEEVCTPESVTLIESLNENYFSKIGTFLEKDINLSSVQILSIFRECHPSVSNRFIEDHKQSLFSKIEEELTSFEKDKYRVDLKVCLAFHKRINKLLNVLIEFSGANDLNYLHFMDRSADTLINASTQYFNRYAEEEDPSEEALKILNLAKKYAAKTSVSDRISKNIDEVRIWRKNLSLRAVGPQIEAIDIVLENLMLNVVDSFSFLESVNSTMITQLIQLSTELGKNHEIAIDRSSCYANVVNKIAVGFTNEKLDKVKLSPSKSYFLQLHDYMNRCIVLLESVLVIDADTESLNIVSINIKDISSLRNQLSYKMGIKSGKSNSRGFFGSIKKMLFE